jgi:hypothetical protein
MRDDENAKIPFNRRNSRNQSTAGAGSVNEIPEDPELRSLLRNYAPHAPLSLENRIMSSYRQQMSQVRKTVSRALYWTWRVAAIAAFGTVLLLAAMRLSTSKRLAEIPRSPVSATAEQGAQKPADPTGQNANVVAPDFDKAGHKAEGGSPQSGTPVTPVGASTSLTSTSSGQITVVMGNPTYVPIAETPPEEPGMGSEYVLTGEVTSEQEVPLPGAIVSIYSSKPTAPNNQWSTPAASQPCDAEGHYTIRLNVPMPNVVVLIEKTGFVKMEDLLSMRAPGTSVKNYKLPLPVACVEGRVFTGESEPLAGASVGVGATWGGGITAHASYISGVTDKSGRFTLLGLPAGRMTVSASARGFIREVVDGPKIITLKAGPCEQVDLHLKPGKTVSFVVKNRQGAVVADPVGHLLLSLKPSFTALMQNGEQGAGTLEWVLAPDAASVPCTVSAKGYKANTFNLDPKAPPVEVILEQADIISGRVVSETGRPVQGAKVTVAGTRRDGGMPPPLEGVVDTDGDGRFVLPLSNPPVSQISVTRQGYVEQKLVFDSQPAPPMVEFRLQFEGAGLFGKVFDSANRPVKRFSMVFGGLPPTSNPIFSRQMESEDGAFLIKNVPAGVYRIHIQSEGEDLQILSAVLEQVEIRKGFMYGPIQISLLPPKSKK